MESAIKTARGPGHPGPGVFDDAWLLRQLPRSPEALLEEAAEEEMLRRENEFLDRYLVRLMKLKRHLDKKKWWEFMFFFLKNGIFHWFLRHLRPENDGNMPNLVENEHVFFFVPGHQRSSKVLFSWAHQLQVSQTWMMKIKTGETSELPWVFLWIFTDISSNYSYKLLFAYHKPVREIGVISSPQLNAI